MARRDSIPDSDAAFNNFQANLIKLCTNNKVSWHIDFNMLNAITPLQASWVAAYDSCKNKNNASAIQRLAKNEAKKAFLKELRPFIQSQIQYNDALSEADKLSCNITPRSKHHKKLPAPVGRPMIDVQQGVGNTIILRYRQETGSEGSSRRGKPENVAWCKIVYSVGTIAPTQPEECMHVLHISRSPQQLNFEMTEGGQKIVGFACWVNSNYKSGLWSEPFQCRIS